MKKIIIFGSLLTVFLMVMMPNINAVNYKVRENAIEQKISNISNNFMDIIGKNKLKIFPFSIIFNLIKLYLFIGILYATITLIYVLIDSDLITNFKEFFYYIFDYFIPQIFNWPVILFFVIIFLINYYFYDFPPLYKNSILSK